jgi:hypothetical protein
MSSSENISNPPRHTRLREQSPFAILGIFTLEILGSLVVLVLVNSFALWYLGNYSTNYGYWTLQRKWALLEKMDAPVDWLILGDSSCNQGVSPALIHEQLGETAINLCTIGNVTALNDVWMLEEYIQRFGPPKGVLIGHVYDVWPRDLDPLILGQIPRRWNFWKEHTLGSDLLGNPDLRSQLFQERYVPLLSQRLTLTTLLRSPMLGQMIPLEPKWRMDEYGFLSGEQAQPATAIQDAQDHMQFVRENDPFVSSINQQALERLVEIADAYQLPIYLVNSPLYEGLSADDGFQAYLAELYGQIDSIVGKSQFIHRISEIKTFPATQLQTADHLILPGAQAYTKWLIENILTRVE